MKLSFYTIIWTLPIKNHLLYQDQYKNCIFLNAERNWGERRGTGIKPFHGLLSGSSPKGYWSFSLISGSFIFVCEAAIDAISLYELKKYPGIYVSIGGCGKQTAIDCLKKKYGSERITIATDADTAGDMTRQRNPDCKSLRPEIGKDWNEMLITFASLLNQKDSIKK